jgi:succinate-semialdehyde dehydrogenase/glutarate-semialdehyde dehydrogenase
MAQPVASPLNDSSLLVDKSYVDGQWVSSESNRTFEVRNPVSETLIGTCPDCTLEDLGDAIRAASRATPEWRSLSGEERERILRYLSQDLLKHKKDLANIISIETGKGIDEAEAEVLIAATIFGVCRVKAPQSHGEHVPQNMESRSNGFIDKPEGAYGIIVPHTFPMALGARAIAMALAAGYSIVVMSDRSTPFSMNALTVLAEQSGLPRGVLNVITASENASKLEVAMRELDNPEELL